MENLVYHLSKCEYYLREPNDGLSDADFERIRAAALEWGRNEEIVCELEKTEDGFTVTFQLPVDDEEAYCMSFYLHLATDTFLHLENRGLWMAHHDD
jgi:hypothetical protein